MLKGGNPLTVGVGIVIEVIRKNNSDYDPDVGAEANAIPSSRDPIYLGTLLRMFAQRVPDFMELILSPNHTIGGGDGPVTIRRKELNAAFGGKIEPLGFDRFKTCELMAELLHCSNMGLLNEIGSEEFVKARDIERERLKADGKLAISPNQAGGEGDLAMKSSTQTRLGSPDGSRKLEVANASDDDGFEEVTHAADLGDDAKDDFDERPGEEDLLAPSKPAPLSFLDKDDEEFVDEPLSSPRLHNVELDRQQPLEPELTPQPLSPTKEPLSPTKELSQDLGSLDIVHEDTAMTSPPPSVNLQAEESEHLVSEDSKPLVETSALNPPHEDVKLGEHEATIVEQVTPQDLETLPHPEDKPAPLFAKKDESTDEPTKTVPEASQSAESLDTTMGEAGDSSQSVIMENTEDHQQSLIDEATTPVVGDFLKMQFVEHKVVPTILVSPPPVDRASLTLVGFLLSISLE
jgi:SIT4-associating protein SAP185/190